MVGYLHPHPILLTCLIVVIFTYFFVTRAKRGEWLHNRREVAIGICLSFCLGFVAEWIGTEKGWWVYRYFEDTLFKFPPWVPFAWGGAYKIFFRIEVELFSVTRSFFLRSIGAALLFLSLPPFGEIIAIAHGTWHYQWQPQAMGMPLQAVVLIGLVHFIVFGIIRLFNSRSKIGPTPSMTT